MKALSRWSVLFLLPVVGSMACSAAPAESSLSPDRSNKTDNSDDDDDNDNTAKDESSLEKRPTTANEGERCGGDEDGTCKSGLTCVKTSGATRGTCRAPGVEGDACGGDEGRTCKNGLTCRTAKSGDEGICSSSNGDAGDVCGGDAQLECRNGLTCIRSSRSANAEGFCGEDEESSGALCQSLSQCCQGIDDLLTRFSCIGAVSAGNEAACGVSLVALCGGFGF